MRFEVSLQGANHQLEILTMNGQWRCRLDGRDIPLDVAQIAQNHLSILLRGKSYDVSLGAKGSIAVGGHSYEVMITDPKSWPGRKQASGGHSGPQKLIASMPGKVVRVLAEKGSKILAGQGILVIEAMKMQNEIRSPREGTVTALLVGEGTSVNAGQPLAIIE
jgi:biotin carboxyl carrier protein